jgi:hypothetical protein
MTPFARASFGVLPAWRPLRDRRLPLWAFLSPHTRLPRAESLRADLRCRLCDSHARCRRRIAVGASTPRNGCPNAELFA